MGLIKGGALRITQSALYSIAFCCAAIILGFYSYFLSVKADRKVPIYKSEKAVEGISGAAVLYTIAATLLTCCLGGVSFFAFLAIALDLLFCGGMIAIIILTRNGASSCKGYVKTPLGNGQAGSSTGGFDGFGEHGNNNVTYSVHLGTACRYETVCFAVAIIGAFIFLVTAAMQLLLVRNHKKEKRYGPSPSNNYTAGSGKKRGGMFGRKNKKTAVEKDSELGMTGTAVGTGAGAGTLAAGHHDIRPSHDTGYTGSTVAAPGATTYDKIDPHHHGNHAPHGTHGGYYTQPQGTGVNPYGYENTQPTHTTGTATNY